jgi:hypothetical protein
LISEDSQGIQKTLEAQETLEPVLIRETLKVTKTSETQETQETKTQESETRETRETRAIISQKSVSQNQRWITFAYLYLTFIIIFMGVGLAVFQNI